MAEPRTQEYRLLVSRRKDQDGLWWVSIDLRDSEDQLAAGAAATSPTLDTAEDIARQKFVESLQNFWSRS